MGDKNILMVDLVGQYDKIKDEINQKINEINKFFTLTSRVMFFKDFA